VHMYKPAELDHDQMNAEERSKADLEECIAINDTWNAEIAKTRSVDI